jgi:2-polyprenyl-3-methyl-5-hydroxy-6-metoxy-1,4-benzoquinol methylase
MIAKLPIVERPIPTYYGDEICRVNGVVYAANCLLSCLRARLQELNLFYDRRFDCAPVYTSQYSPKFAFDSTHSFTLKLIPEKSKVIDLGCADGHVAFALKQQKGCYVAGVDVISVPQRTADEFYLRDLNDGIADIPIEEYDFVLLLDVLEHLVKPEAFLDRLRERLSLNPKAELIVSTGNVAFIITRLMLLFGQFNYGKKGILDLTHTRLFTFGSLVRALRQAGFTIVETKAVPAPFHLAVRNSLISNILSTLNSFLNRLLPALFAYQVIVRAKARPTVESLLRAAQEASRTRVEHLLVKSN